MSPITHFLLGWLVANVRPLEKRERALVVFAGVAPDIDGLGIVAELLTRNSKQPRLWWTEYHHVLAHNLLAGLLLTGLGFAIGTKRIRVALLVLLSFHLHLLGDLVGARGPEGFQWPIRYFWPFNDKVALVWEGQWALNAWPNMAITALALGLTFFLAWRYGYSPLEMVSTRADRRLVETLRQRFPRES